MFSKTNMLKENDMSNETSVTVGAYTVIQSSNHHIHIYKDGRMVMHASCAKKMTEEELKAYAGLYEAVSTDRERQKEGDEAP